MSALHDLPVLIDGWQMECCGTPPAVGDTVSWRLRWSPPSAFDPPTRLSLEARLAPLPPPSRTVDDAVPAVATIGGLSAFVRVSAPLADSITLTGVLNEDHHVGVPREVRPTTGLVTGVWLVSREYELRDCGWCPVEGATRLEEELLRAPKFLPRAPFPGSGTTRRDTDAILATVTCA